MEADFDVFMSYAHADAARVKPLVGPPARSWFGDDVVKLMDALQAQSATGYAAFHAWSTIRVPTIKGETAADLEQLPNFRRLRRFIIPGQPSTAELVRHPGTHELVVEFFTTAPPDSMVLDTGLSGSVERLADRSQLTRKTFSVKDAMEANQYDTPAGANVIVTIKR